MPLSHNAEVMGRFVCPEIQCNIALALELPGTSGLVCSRQRQGPEYKEITKGIQSWYGGEK